MRLAGDISGEREPGAAADAAHETGSDLSKNPGYRCLPPDTGCTLPFLGGGVIMATPEVLRDYPRDYKQVPERSRILEKGASYAGSDAAEEK